MDKCKASVETFDKRLPEVVELDQAKERLETLKGESNKLSFFVVSGFFSELLMTIFSLTSVSFLY